MFFFYFGFKIIFRNFHLAKNEMNYLTLNLKIFQNFILLRKIIIELNVLKFYLALNLKIFSKIFKYFSLGGKAECVVFRPHKFVIRRHEGVVFRFDHITLLASGRHNGLSDPYFVFVLRRRVVVEIIHESQCL